MTKIDWNGERNGRGSLTYDKTYGELLFFIYFISFSESCLPYAFRNIGLILVGF